jgi:hypothetical protein
MCLEATNYFASRISGAQVCYSKYAFFFDWLDSIKMLLPVELVKSFCILIHHSHS